jgi:hypothetical protein
MNEDPRAALDRRLAALPREIAPPADWWPDIAAAARRSRARRGAVPAALAAGFICLIFGAVAAWMILQVRRVTPVPPYSEPQDPGYRAARQHLEETFRERLAQLDPGTRARVESSLDVIRAAREDLRRALGAEPGNPLLEQLLESTLHDEFDLYDRVVSATQPSQTRSSP